MNYLSSLDGAHGGFIRHASNLCSLCRRPIVMAALFANSACQAASTEAASSGTAEEQAVAQQEESVVDETPSGVNETASTPKPDVESEEASDNSEAKTVEPLSGTYLMRIVFDESVNVRPRNEADQSGAQPDGSQISMLEIESRSGKVVKCVQSSRKGAVAKGQPACTAVDDGLKIEIADENATFNARMETIVKPSGNGSYKGPLSLYAVLLPNGMKIGEVTLTPQ